MTRNVVLGCATSAQKTARANLSGGAQEPGTFQPLPVMRPMTLVIGKGRVTTHATPAMIQQRAMLVDGDSTGWAAAGSGELSATNPWHVRRWCTQPAAHDGDACRRVRILCVSAADGTVVEPLPFDIAIGVARYLTIDYCDRRDRDCTDFVARCSPTLLCSLPPPDGAAARPDGPLLYDAAPMSDAAPPRPGDAIVLRAHRGEPTRREHAHDGSCPCGYVHMAMHLGGGYYLSKLGSGGRLAVARIADMIDAYSLHGAGERVTAHRVWGVADRLGATLDGDRRVASFRLPAPDWLPPDGAMVHVYGEHCDTMRIVRAP